MSGRDSIEDIEKLLLQREKILPPGSMKMLVAPIYAALPNRLQLKVFEKTPENTRKIILGKNK